MEKDGFQDQIEETYWDWRRASRTRSAPPHGGSQRQASTPQLRSDEQLALIRNFSESQWAEGTKRAYRRVVQELFQFMGTSHPAEITSSQLITWRDSLISHNKPSTVCFKLNVIWSFYEYLRAAEFLDKNPATNRSVPRPELSKFIAGRALTCEEVQCLLAGPDRSTPVGARDYALLTIMLRLALRVSEACSLRTSSIWVNKGRYVVTCRVKGGRDRAIALPNDVWITIQHYIILDSAKNKGREANDPYIFQPSISYRTANGSRPLSSRRAYDIVSKWAELTGLGDLSPHDLRRTAITRALEQGLSYRQIQSMTGHQQPQTVMIYDYTRDSLINGAANFLYYEVDDEGESVNGSQLSESKSRQPVSMFARWKKRRLKRREANDSIEGAVRSAVLVRAIRINGKPRQKIVQYLGSIRDSQIEESRCRVRFWFEVERKLKGLEIADELYNKVLITLSMVVPLPTVEEVNSLTEIGSENVVPMI